MPDNRLPNKLLFSELQHGKRSLGGPKKCYKDTLKGSLKSFNLNPDTWELAAQYHSEWRAACCFAQWHKNSWERPITAERRRQARKSNIDRCSSSATIPCPSRTRTFCAQIGLTSHLRTHQLNRMIRWSSLTWWTNNRSFLLRGLHDSTAVSLYTRRDGVTGPHSCYGT